MTRSKNQEVRKVEVLQAPIPVVSETHPTTQTEEKVVGLTLTGPDPVPNPLEGATPATATPATTEIKTTKTRKPRKPKDPTAITDAKAGPVVYLLECKKITALASDKGLRTFNKEFAENLAHSIKIEGMYNPIIVRPNPEKIGHFLVVQGKHRLYAKKTLLKEQFIECQVMQMDDADAEFAMITENIWRNPLTKGQQSASVARWFIHYQAKFANKGGDGAALQAPGNSAIMAASPTDPAAVLQAPVAGQAPVATRSEDAEEFDVTKRVSGFTELLAASTGLSKRAAERELKIARAFDEDQLQVLDQEKVGTVDRETISKVKDVGDRTAIVNLISSGMVADDAIKAVMKDAAPKPSNKEAKDASAVKKSVKDEVNVALSNEDWFTTYCSEKAALLGDPTKYKSDAILYRQVVEFRALYRSKVKDIVKLTKAAGSVGPFYSALNRHINFAHPKEWALCGNCGGNGVDPTDEAKKCKKCYGSCYELVVEEKTD